MEEDKSDSTTVRIPLSKDGSLEADVKELQTNMNDFSLTDSEEEEEININPALYDKSDDVSETLSEEEPSESVASSPKALPSNNLKQINLKKIGGQLYSIAKLLYKQTKQDGLKKIAPAFTKRK